jgi:hypothetical protein
MMKKGSALTIVLSFLLVTSTVPFMCVGAFTLFADAYTTSLRFKAIPEHNTQLYCSLLVVVAHRRFSPTTTSEKTSGKPKTGGTIPEGQVKKTVMLN